MCQDTNLPGLAMCACGAHFYTCDMIDALLHIRPGSSTAHYWTYIRGNSFVAGRDNKTFDKGIRLFGEPLKRREK